MTAVDAGDNVAELVAALFAEALGRTQVPVDVDFFESGGDSLQALRLVRRLERRLERPVAIGRFFLEPTVSGLIEAVAPGQSQPPDGRNAS